MPLLSYEGVEVDIPTSLTGIQFSFKDGTLTIQCANFTGDVVLSKGAPTVTSVAGNNHSTATSTSAFVPTTSAAMTSQLASSGIKSKKRSLNQSDFVVDEDDEDDSESSASELLTKRLRPNFLNDVEQSMLLAQLETASSQGSLTVKTGEDADSIISSSGASVSEKESGRQSSTKAKPPVSRLSTPSSSFKPLASKKNTNTVQTTLFSPDATKQPPASRKATPDSQKKRGRPPKNASKTLDESSSSAAATAVVSIKDATSTKASKVTTMTTTTMTTAIRAKEPVRAQWDEVEVQGTVPVERWGDSVTKISNDRVVVYGGVDDDEMTLGDLHVYDLKKREWSKPLNCESIPRAWHDAVYLESKHLLLVFGGERFMGGNQMDVLSDIMVLDTECFLWYPPAVSGVTPMARSGHSCTVVGNDIVVFGGSRGRNRQSTVHVLDSDTWHWKNVKIEGKPPSARTYHSAVAVGGDRVIIFGGNDAKKSFNSVHVLRKKGGDADTWTWFHPCVVGAPPQARTGHSATLVDRSKILIFGGWDPQREDSQATSVFNDGFLLNTETWEWESLTVSKAEEDSKAEAEASLSLPGRVGHRAVIDSNNKVYFFGGQNGAEKRLNAIHSLALYPPGADDSDQQQLEPEAEAKLPHVKAEQKQQ